MEIFFRKLVLFEKIFPLCRDIAVTYKLISKHIKYISRPIVKSILGRIFLVLEEVLFWTENEKSYIFYMEFY